jgi:hypothetical protein
MKQIIWVVGGLCAATAGLLVWQQRGNSVKELAHRLEVDWAANHHTVV